MSDENSKRRKPAMNDSLMRSYGRVNGRKLGKEQTHLIENVLPKVALEIESDNVSGIYETSRPVCIEIGFGGGEHLAQYAAQNPEILCIGCEPFINGVARLLKYIDSDNIENIKILHGDARMLLEQTPDSSVDKIFLLFPDPWPKARHHKKRIVNDSMLDELSRVLKKGGILEIATDHADYADWIDEHLAKADSLSETETTKGQRLTPPQDWIRTRYQEKGEEAGRYATFFNFVRQ